jgi:hypothetical protein
VSLHLIPFRDIPAVNAEHGRVKSTFEAVTAKGKAKPFTNWSGKTRAVGV